MLEKDLSCVQKAKEMLRLSKKTLELLLKLILNPNQASKQHTIYLRTIAWLMS